MSKRSSRMMDKASVPARMRFMGSLCAEPLLLLPCALARRFLLGGNIGRGGWSPLLRAARQALEAGAVLPCLFLRCAKVRGLCGMWIVPLLPPARLGSALFVCGTHRARRTPQAAAFALLKFGLQNVNALFAQGRAPFQALWGLRGKCLRQTCQEGKKVSALRASISGPRTALH